MGESAPAGTGGDSLGRRRYAELRTVEWGESIWTTPLLIGIGEMKGLGSWFLVLLLLANISMQGVFAAIVGRALAVKDIDEDTVRDLLRWRLNIAHDVKYYNVLGEQSMTQRVCSGDAGLESSTSQEELFLNLDQYLGPNDSHLQGPATCILGACKRSALAYHSPLDGAIRTASTAAHGCVSRSSPTFVAFTTSWSHRESHPRHAQSLPVGFST